MSHPKVSHQVETNVVTQASHPPVISRESAPAAPPRAAADDRHTSALGCVDRISVHPPAGRSSAGRPCAFLLTAQYPVWARPRDGPSSSRDRIRRVRRTGHGQRFKRRPLGPAISALHQELEISHSPPPFRVFGPGRGQATVLVLPCPSALRAPRPRRGRSRRETDFL